jgi:FkbM family methyltransferase
MILNLNDTGANSHGSVGEYIYNQIFLKGEYPDTFNENDTVVDIGGHVGLFALWASKKIPNSVIHSFEPSNKNIQKFLFHINENNVKNVILHKKAVTSNNEDVVLFLSQDTGANSIYKKCAHEFFEKDPLIDSCKVSSTTLCNIIDDLGYISYLKIDCEGAEYAILESLSNIYFKKIKQIVLEWHPVEGKSIKDLETLLNDNSFKTRRLRDEGNYGVLFAFRNDNVFTE